MKNKGDKMPGLVVHGKVVQIPGLNINNYKDHPGLLLKMGEDMRLRNTRWVRGIVLHTTKGEWPQKVSEGLGPNTNVEDRIARLWSTDHRQAGAHLSVDWDGSIGCHCDLRLHAAYHAGAVNEYTIGIEMYQGPKPENALYEKQLDVTVKLVNELTRLFGIQRQVPNLRLTGVVPRLAAGGKDFCGVYGHRNVTTDRGRGDPGDHIFTRLLEAGYEQWDIVSGEDLAIWRQRQAELLEVAPESCDGIPGPQTVDALRFVNYTDGLWVAVKEKE